MRAYKCDRCGDYFDISNKFDDNKRVCLSIFKAGRWTTADLCDKCARKLENWFTMFGLKEVDDYEMDAKAEQEVSSYGGLEETEEDET